MTRSTVWTLIVLGFLALAPGLAAYNEAPGERGPDDPIFVRWMDPADPQDQTILDYWRRAEADQLDAVELVDLGTMLFHRGYPKDAVRSYKAALDVDPEMPEAWFRIGLVKHREGELDDARYAYRRCLKLLTGHGWCNFYRGLLEEQTGHPRRALDFYRRAFKFAPELADPTVNPELLYSDLYLAALVRREQKQRLTSQMPLRFLEPDEVAAVRAQYEATPVPGVAPSSEAPVAAVTAAPIGSASAGQERAPRLPVVRPSRTPAEAVPSTDEMPFGTPRRRAPTPTVTDPERDNDSN